MAAACLISKNYESVLEIKEFGFVQLEMTSQEAVSLLHILYYVGGPMEGPRGFTDEIMKQLETIDELKDEVKRLNSISPSPLNHTGDIIFE